MVRRPLLLADAAAELPSLLAHLFASAVPAAREAAEHAAPAAFCSHPRVCRELLEQLMALLFGEAPPPDRAAAA